MDSVALVIVAILTFAVFSLFFIEGVRHLEERREESPEEEGGESQERPWWGNPLVWIGISVVFLLLGLFVAPRFLPGVIVFVPFIWISRFRSGRPGRPERS